MFSKKMTMFNMLINGLCLGAVFGLVQVWPGARRLTILLLVVSLPLFIPAIILSMVFLYMEKCCGCCCLTVTCCNIQDKGEVFDPDQEDEVEMEEVQVQDEEQ